MYLPFVSGQIHLNYSRVIKKLKICQKFGESIIKLRTKPNIWKNTVFQPALYL